jgi:hypothetical protein
VSNAWILNPKLGKSLDGHMIGWLAQAYSKSINDGASLNIGDAWGQVSKSRNVKAVKDAVSPSSNPKPLLFSIPCSIVPRPAVLKPMKPEP